MRLSLFGQMYQREKGETWEQALAKVGRGFAHNPQLRDITPTVCLFHPGDYADLFFPHTVQAGDYTVPARASCPPGRNYVWLCVEEKPIAAEFAAAKTEFSDRVEALVQ